MLRVTMTLTNIIGMGWKLPPLPKIPQFIFGGNFRWTSKRSYNNDSDHNNKDVDYNNNDSDYNDKDSD